MGEAKRRKKLDPNYGKPLSLRRSQVLSNSEYQCLLPDIDIEATYSLYMKEHQRLEGIVLNSVENPPEPDDVFAKYAPLFAEAEMAKILSDDLPKLERLETIQYMKHRGQLPGGARSDSRIPRWDLGGQEHRVFVNCLETLLKIAFSASALTFDVTAVSFLEPENKAETRKVGEILSGLGGVGWMRAAAKHVPKRQQRELDYAFDGIAGWLA